MVRDSWILSRLGSRFSLRFEPQGKYLYASPLGRGFDRPLRLEISAVTDSTRLVWPFSAGEQFDACTCRRTLSGMEFTLVSFRLGFELQVTFTAPFYPHDEKTSCAPLFYLDVVGRRTTQSKSAVDIKVALFAREDETVTRDGTAVLLHGDYQLVNGSDDIVDEFSRRRFSALLGLAPLSGRLTLRETTFTFTCRDDEPACASFVLAAHCSEPVLLVDGRPQQFSYLRYFASLNDVAAFARSEESRIRSKIAFLDSVVGRSSLSVSEKDSLAEAIHSLLSNTWWTCNGDDEWFGCWNEEAVWNSIAAEYRASLFYLNFWPELLERQIEQRAASARENNCFPSSCGRLLHVNSAGGPVANEETICEHLLLLFSYWRWWNAFHVIEEYFPTWRNLALLLVEFWQLGRDSRTNDHKELPPLKLLCALHAAAMMADEVGDEELSRLLADMQRQVAQSPEIKSETRVGALLHHLMCDHLPEIDHVEVRRNLLGSQSGLGENGHPADSGGFLDALTAAYFGIRFSDSLLPRKAAIPPASHPVNSALADTERNWAAFGIIQALLGLKFDRVEQTFSISPLSVPAHLPLIPFADWQNMHVPRVDVWCEGNQVKADVSKGGLVEHKLNFAVEPHRELKWRG